MRITGCRTMVLVVAGTADVGFSGKWLTVTSGYFIDVLEGTSLQFGQTSPDLDLYCIFTTRDFMRDVLQNMIPGPKNYIFKVMMNPAIRLSGASSSVMLRQMELIDGTLRDMMHYHRVELVRTYFRSFLLELGNILVNEQDWQMPPQILAKRDLLMGNFMDLVWKNFTSNRDISFYATELCISPKHLSRVVKEATGKTPHEIIAIEVLGLSMQLLRDEDMLVQQIADTLHFSDQAAFSKFFKKYTGISPMEFRKNH